MALTRIVGHFMDEGRAASAVDRLAHMGLDARAAPGPGAAHEDVPSLRRAALGAAWGAGLGLAAGVLAYFATALWRAPTGVVDGVAHGGMLLVLIGAAVVTATAFGALVGLGFGRGALRSRAASREAGAGPAAFVVEVRAPEERAVEVARLLADEGGAPGHA